MIDHVTVDRPDLPVRQERQRLVNPSGSQVLDTITEGSFWLGKFCSDPNWDGGGLWFGFAGHGRSGDGALIFDDGSVVTATDFVSSCSELARQLEGKDRLRLSVFLDSCYSGAFVLDDSTKSGVIMRIALCHSTSSRLRFQTRRLGKCLMSARARHILVERIGNALGSVGAEAVGPDNTPIPTLCLAESPYGVPLLAAGHQHTLEHLNGTGHLTGLRRDVPLFDDDQLRSRDDIAKDIFAMRAETINLFRQYRALTGVIFRDG